MASARKFCEGLLKKADIQIGGDRPQDITVHDERFYNRIIQYGSLGLGESYMDGWWDAKDLDAFIYKIIIADLAKNVRYDWHTFRLLLNALFTNRQSRMRATRVAKEHYDLSAELYMSFLDPYNQYTCGYFKNTDSLNVAQEQKLDLSILHGDGSNTVAKKGAAGSGTLDTNTRKG